MHKHPNGVRRARKPLAIRQQRVSRIVAVLKNRQVASLHWYGLARDVDMSFTSHSLAYCLHGASHGGNDIYVMINVYWEPPDFTI